MKPPPLSRQLPSAGTQALALLDPARGAVEAPIRAEIFGAARFAQHGHSLALAHQARVRARAAPFFPRMRENMRVLHEAHDFIAQQAATGHHVNPAGEWLLDNFYVVMAQTKEIHEGLPQRYFRDLPVLVEAHLAGLPRIYGVAWAFAAHTDSAFDEDLLVHFLKAYQETRELTLGELWALPTSLRVVLVENLRRLAERVAAAKAARACANAWCDTLQGSDGSQAAASLQPVIDSLRERGVDRLFVLQAMQRLALDAGGQDPRKNGVSAEVAAQVRDALAQALPEPANAQVQLHAEQAADNLSVRNAITSLRLLSNTDWRSVVARTSVLLRQLQRSPTFCAERDDTQDTSLHAIERLARRSGHSELEVAQTLLALMKPHALPDAMPRGEPSDAPTEAPGYWLRGPGLPALRRALGLDSALQAQWLTRMRRAIVPAYLGVAAAGSVGLAVWCVGHSARPAAGAGWLALLALLALFPASETVIAVLHRLISESLPPRHLPRLALAQGVPPQHRVLVVVPAMLTHASGIAALARQLELHYLANCEPHAQFALLSDYADADAAALPSDGALLQLAIDAVDALEQRYADTDAEGQVAQRRFLLLHRERQWSETEQRWIGWERKRGKLEQLIGLLATQGHSPFVDLGARSRPVAGTPYVVTLDSDTGLPPGTLRALVGVAAHPLNRPRVDVARRRVASGYGILQPRLTTPLPNAHTATPFHWLFAGQCGVDPYSAATSEVYQDLFAEGSFSGKGLLHVGAMQAVLSARLPPEQILSHDLLEGSLARCAGVSDITLMEDAPLHADVAASRVHRWTRGDWQLWPVLAQRRRFDLLAIHRWKMVDNLRRSLMAPMSGTLVLACLATGAVSPWRALALVAAAYGAGPMLGAIAGLAPGRDDLALGHFYRQALADVARALGSTVWGLAVLLQQGMQQAHAIGTAWWRMAVSRRGLLQWTTAASAQATAQGELAQLALRHAPVTLAAAALGALLWALAAPHLWLALGLCAVWAAAPLWIWGASRPWQAGRTPAPSTADREYLLGVARDTWTFFVRHVGPQTHHLPPDNVQTVPRVMVAQRTSPTNIGMYLLSVACARRFGWIGTEELLERCERTLATLALLARHRGHFLNWYGTHTLEPLDPRYVSTVDSGNFCGHLLALAGACTEMASAAAPACEGIHRQRLQQLASRCHGLAMAAQFGFLYDPRRRLFHIGYRVADEQLDESFYDLLASESRLASLWAIAKGDVPASHWSALGRPFYAVGWGAGLRSWSGSMFEYLMPALVIDEPAGSVLETAARSAVREQRAFAQVHGMPWGISESAYAASDHTLAYQYAPQGVPRLALRRTPADERVVAPYASALAAMYEPGAAVANLRRLERLHARSEMGFMDALDFTAERQLDGSAVTRVQTYMAHHQGMVLVALANVLLDAAPRRWAMGEARLCAVGALLQERVPREVSRLQDPEPLPRALLRSESGPSATRDVVPGDGALQPTLLLSNGRYSVSLRANGAGWSRWNAADVSRWRDDALRDAHGSFLYLRRHGTDAPGAPVSLSQHPAPDPHAHYHASFHSDQLRLHAQWPDLRSCCTVWVSPEDDIELRRVELWNPTAQAITLEVLSMFEVSLLGARADEAHPAFANLFVQADWDAEDLALYLARKPHVEHQEPMHAVHFMAHCDHPLAHVQVQTDRARWLGRNRDAGHPLAQGAARGTGTAVTGLDPIAALSVQITVAAHSSARLTWATAAAASREALETLVDRYRQPAAIERSALMSAMFASVRLREMALSADDRGAIQTLSSALALLHARPPMYGAGSAAPRCDRRTLWRHGISGDRPCIVVDISATHGLRLVRSLVQALRLWSWGGLACDLILVNAEPWSYLMPLQRELQALRERYAIGSTAPERACGLHVLHASDVTPDDQATFTALARLRLNADGRSLAHHVRELVEWHDAALDARMEQSVALPAVALGTLSGGAPTGRFDRASGNYCFDVSPVRRPARPWINVLANPGFGAQVSEAGAGYSWAGNSRLHQLTVWSNDPVTDPGGECFWLQDLRSREVWNVGAGAGSADTVYAVEHGQGITTLRHQRGDVEVLASWCVDAHRPLKQVRIAVRNRGARPVQLRAIGMLEWVMGAQRLDRQSVHTARAALPATRAGDAAADVLLATQSDGHAGFGGCTAFFALQRVGSADARLVDWTCDRRELFDSRGQRVVPDHFGARAGTGLDPCAAASTTLQLPRGAQGECVFVLGHGDTREAALALAREALAHTADEREAAVSAHWSELLGAVTVHTPDALFDALTNRWLLYQTVACRLWARAGFYQAGGAFGFRDQLQDTMALAVAAPRMLRAQLLLAASRQFAEGDVQHWWHAPTGAGVRTRCSDDLLWLPHAALRYVAMTGDAAVLDETVPFLEGAPVPAAAQDAYFVPEVSALSASLYEHCARTLDRSLAVGAHGLPLMGSGDWNDGMSRVGDQGRGESVWLGWFLCDLVRGFAPVALARNEPERARRWQAAARGWQAALQGRAWDGEWFQRAFFDDGTPLGTHRAHECRIDLIAQAWGVLSGAATPEQQQTAMASAARWLVDEAHGLNRLLDPPLQHATPYAGYIQAYPPGVRENGGQYSHAGVWKLMAQAQLGDADGAYRTFTQLSPAHRSADPDQGPVYGIEPYVMAADVYTHAPYVGRGGWSWYTGSAAWMHRAAVESICGLRVRPGQVGFVPRLPSHWPSVAVTLRRDGRVHEFIVCAASATAELERARARGAFPLAEGAWLSLADTGGDSLHVVVARAPLPSPSAAAVAPLPAA
ncbi:hypothetical protein B2J88_19210 [Rhodococcus sp. SRB_17]|nr:hypothetical protein [Rhodococcus sp. SRB_17]